MDHPRKLIATRHIPIRWRDMDINSHVYNANYFVYASEALCAWMTERVDILQVSREETLVAVNAQCTFYKALGYPGTAVVTMYLGKPGRSSIPLYFEIRLDGDETLCAEGVYKLVWSHLASGKSVSLPDFVRRLAED